MVVAACGWQQPLIEDEVLSRFRVFCSLVFEVELLPHWHGKKVKLSGAEH